MVEYKNEEYLKKQIMEQSRHLFIYGYNNEHRTQFLKSLEKKYPIIFDSNKPIALYFDSLGFPKVDADLNNNDSHLIHTMSREYLYFTIASKILLESMENDKEILNNRLTKLISLINRNKNIGHAEIETADDLLKEIETSRNFYYENYLNYVNGLIKNIPVNDITVPFLQLEMFISKYKEAMNIDSYFGIIFDKKGQQAINSTQAINNLIGGRINKDISVKAVIEPNDWETYYDANGQYIEATHDYGTVEMDNSFQNHIKTLKKNF